MYIYITYITRIYFVCKVYHLDGKCCHCHCLDPCAGLEAHGPPQSVSALSVVQSAKGTSDLGCTCFHNFLSHFSPRQAQRPQVGTYAENHVLTRFGAQIWKRKTLKEHRTLRELS